MQSMDFIHLFLEVIIIVIALLGRERAVVGIEEFGVRMSVFECGEDPVADNLVTLLLDSGVLTLQRQLYLTFR